MALWETLSRAVSELHEDEPRDENLHNTGELPSSSGGQKRKRDIDAGSCFPWVPAVISLFQPMYNVLEQKTTVNILTACSGTGCPTWALKDIHMQLKSQKVRKIVIHT
eukprot:6458003-Amphidinium_carterae.1